MSTEEKGFVEIDSNQIPPTDIVFRCPHCDRQHSIDPRGAGLTIHCTACNKLVPVPIPPGVDIADFDETVEHADALVMHLRKALHSATTRTRELEAKLDALTKARAELHAALTNVVALLNKEME